MPTRSRKVSRYWSTALIAGTAMVLGAGPSAAANDHGTAATSSANTKQVSYHGYALSVPADWPIIDLSQAPQTCVRFDQHAVYLGHPGSEQSCPAQVIGRTEAVVVEPLDAATGDRIGSHTIQVTGPRAAPATTPSGTDGEITEAIAGAGVLVTASYGTDAQQAQQILTGARLTADAKATAQLPVHQSAVTPDTANYLEPGTYAGKGFDACSLPSSSTMSTWLASSPYRAVGVYFGGINRGCSQPNLTAGWMSTQVGAGWHLIPLYVGLQAPCSTQHVVKMSSDPGTAYSQGVSGAKDMDGIAQSIGLSTGSILYNDMESYDNGNSSCKTAVLNYLSGWTTQVRASGYKVGVYSSASTGVADLAANYNSTTYPRPDDIYGALWDGTANTSLTPYAPDSDWANHHRIKQYRSGHNETYGGTTVNVDNDYLDVTSGYAGKMGEITDVGDRNGDKTDDFVAIEHSTGNLYLYTSPAYSGTDRTKLGWGWNSIRDLADVGDHNGDGAADLIGIDTADNHMYLYYGPDFSGTTRVDLGGGWSSYTDIAAVGDHNGDSIPDFVATDSTTGNLYLYTSPNYLGSQRQQTGTGWTGTRDITDAGDHNGDGKDDFIAVNGSDNHMYLYYGPGYSGTTRVDLGGGWSSYTDIAAVGDQNGDGIADFVATDSSTGNLYLYTSPNYLGSQREQIGTGW
ncbi:FG-GAP repeat protein [Catenulispora acidiphila DSM 44928]|uniref:FG-GAP repeat protein n=1 Tax=Catenulispora acidiphila (strain DSM 44928 / JCM 14897 / NBRC 102108 / NRRL B-24433 / ID139908) TaxID=479433 RepID=C7PXN4_CATAD|nr:glycoside hydrolase domain-containing protein [Catenulispora acidiphila]ACU71487.1 FG-GAP repeat protein [Catenulispora acidiphila DSM 44928]